MKTKKIDLSILSCPILESHIRRGGLVLLEYDETNFQFFRFGLIVPDTYSQRLIGTLNIKKVFGDKTSNISPDLYKYRAIAYVKGYEIETTLDKMYDLIKEAISVSVFGSDFVGDL